MRSAAIPGIVINVVILVGVLFASWNAAAAFPMRVQDPEAECEPDQACFHVQRKNTGGFWKSFNLEAPHGVACKPRSCDLPQACAVGFADFPTTHFCGCDSSHVEKCHAHFEPKGPMEDDEIACKHSCHSGTCTLREYDTGKQCCQCR